MKPGERSFLTDKQDQDFRSYVEIQRNGLAIVIVTDKEYPKNAILLTSREIVAEFEKTRTEKEFENITGDVDWRFPALEEKIKKYQNPQEADPLLNLKSQLEEINEIMTKNVDELMRRGETIQGLMVKSKDVSTLSYNFYRKSREANKKCCSLY